MMGLYERKMKAGLQSHLVRDAWFPTIKFLRSTSKRRLSYLRV